MTDKHDQMTTIHVLSHVPDAAVGAGAALNPLYGDGGHIHPSSAGGAAMAGVIDTAAL